MVLLLSRMQLMCKVQAHRQQGLGFFLSMWHPSGNLLTFEERSLIAILACLELLKFVSSAIRVDYSSRLFNTQSVWGDRYSEYIVLEFNVISTSTVHNMM
jgi:hypothetical protein